MSNSEKKRSFYSVARWTKVAPSRDYHSTEEMAKGVAYNLLRFYGPGTKGCPIRGHCLDSWWESKLGDESESTKVPNTNTQRKMQVS